MTSRESPMYNYIYILYDLDIKPKWPSSRGPEQ